MSNLIKKKYYEFNDTNINYFNYDNDISKEIRMGINSNDKCDNTNNIKRLNINYGNYYNPSNMSNSGFGDINIYNKLLYPIQTRDIQMNMDIRESNINRLNNNEIFNYNLYNVNDKYFRNGFDTRETNKSY